MEKEIAEFVRLFEGEKDFIMADATGRVSNAIVRRTPVDEGDTVADWDVAIGHWPTDTKPPPYDPRKTNTRRRLRATVDRVKFGEAVFFENTNEAAVHLEYGSSQQAPTGILRRVVVRRWRTFVRNAGIAAQRKVKKRLSGD